ncbi:ATP-binding protein [Pantanalinema sp. GBBB05]|uniref:ATP-binding protein n=1 Tax=Pantanalinema sp. GBBB05 TaxID=2604139 RepID=UPI001D3FE646|nr:HAMP domain-containing protein [Pantanalinema sp. GBBB05]
MNRPSFRLRIALLSSLLAGSALVGFGIFSWWLIYQTKLKRVDDSIKTQLLRESDRPRPIEHWQSYTDSLPVTLGTNTLADQALLIKNAAGEIVYQSATWKIDLTHIVIFPPLPLPVQRQANLPPPPFPPQQPPPGQRPPPPLEQPGELDLPPNRPPGDAIGMPPPPRQVSDLVTRSTQTETWRLGTVSAPYVRIAIAVNLHSLYSEMEAIRNAFLVAIPLVLVLIAIGAWWLSGTALQPIREVTATLRQVTAKGLDQRVSINKTDSEFAELLQVFNQMMERLERSFTQASRFSADAAHELKTPLAILQGELERTLQAAQPGSTLQQRLSNLLDEVHHLGAIVRKLLLLSLADAGQMRLHTTEVDVSKLLVDLVDDIDMLAPDLDVQVQMQPALKVTGDQALLTQVLQNLISNATKYNLPSGWIRIEAGQRHQRVFITISNASKEIAASERSRIFDRFHRGDPARTQHVEGLGLGLSLSREIAYAHGGNLTLDHSPRGATAFTLTLPI